MTDPLGVLSLRPSGREGASYLSCTDPMSLWSPTAFLFEVRNAALSDESESRSTSGFNLRIRRWRIPGHERHKVQGMRKGV